MAPFKLYNVLIFNLKFMCALVYEVNTCYSLVKTVMWVSLDMQPCTLCIQPMTASNTPCPPSFSLHISMWGMFLPLLPSGYLKYNMQHARIDHGAHHWCKSRAVDILLWEKSPRLPGKLGWGGGQTGMQEFRNTACCWA